MMTSNMVQRVKINYEHNLVTKAVAVIFVNERIDSQFQYYDEEQKKQI